MVAVGLLVVTSCSDDDDGGGGVSSTVTSVPSATGDPGSSVDPGDATLTAPRDATSEIRDLLGTPGPTVATADELAAAVADALVAAAAVNECETGPPTAVVSSVTPGEPTFAVVEISVGCDDSVAGSRYDLAMEPDDSTGWALSSSTRQDICSRGVDGDVCV